MKKSKAVCISVDVNIIHLWENCRIGSKEAFCLYELISREKKVVDDIPRLRKYFKTKSL